MYPRVILLHQGDLRPIVTGHVYVDKSATPFNLTGLLSCRFYLLNLATDALKINGAAGVVDIPGGTLSYTWVGTDTDTTGRFASWFVGYWGAISTLPQTFEGPEVRIFAPGQRLVW